MDVYYVNSKEKKICLTKKPYELLDGATIFDYSLSYTTAGETNPKIKRFSNKIKKGNMAIIVSGGSREEYCSNINAMMDIISYDVDAGTPGRLYCGDQYCEGYVFENEHGTDYNNSKRAELKLKFVAENGNWIHEEKKSFAKVTNELYETEGLDYPHDYPFDYSNNLVNQKIVNDNYAASDFEMVIYGSCDNPAISIGTHTYEVNASLIVGEYIVINSLTRKIYKVKNNGEQVNLFYLRGRDFYIFEKIPAGIMSVAWNGSFGFDIKLMSERSEPKWI